MPRSPAHDFVLERLLAGSDFEVAGAAAGVGYRITGRSGEFDTAPFTRIPARKLEEAVEGGLPLSIGATVYLIERSFGPAFLEAAREASRVAAVSVTVQSPLRVHCVIGLEPAPLAEALGALLPPEFELAPGTLVEGSREWGRKVGHAAKDLAGLREATFSAEHLETLERSGAAEAFEAVKKDAVWPAPTIDALRGQGLPPAVAFGVVSVWRMLQQRPARTPAARRAFVRDLPAVRAALEECRTVEDFAAAVRAHVEATGREAEAVLGKRLSSFAARLRPHLLSYHSHGDIVLRDLLALDAGEGDEGHWERIASALAGKAGGRKSAGLPLPERPSLPLDQVRREGPGLPAVPPPGRIPVEFGIAGLEFGNYVGRGEGECLEGLLAGAFADLRQTVGDWIVRLCRVGNLSLALGARGKGQGCAHYEPALRVINLTKSKGDGSLAHEFAHFLDHILADHIPEGESRYLSARATRARPQGHAVAAAMKEVMDDILLASRRERVTGEVKPNRWYRETWMRKNGYDPASPAQESFDRIAARSPDIFRGGRDPRGESVLLVNSLARFSESPVEVEIAYEGKTDFAREAKALGTYWSRPEELFARAFESFVEDEAVRRGWTSQYLVTGTRKDYTGCRGLPYPLGSERERMAAAMRRLLEACKDKWP